MVLLLVCLAQFEPKCDLKPLNMRIASWNVVYNWGPSVFRRQSSTQGGERERERERERESE